MTRFDPSCVFDRGLTWRGRVAVVWYRLRRLVITPAPESERCAMGWPIGEHIRCPRRRRGGSLWCRRCEP